MAMTVPSHCETCIKIRRYGLSGPTEIPLETRKALLGHAVGDITTHYSAAELGELLKAAEAIVSRSKNETPDVMLVGQKAEKTVGKVSEMRKGSTEKCC